MLTTEPPIIQHVISDNEKIYEAIVEALKSANKEILVATSWFTDPQLFEVLLVKKLEGISVDVIMGDNQENERLSFDTLKEKGANVLKVKNVGYGIMHQKFCVVDRRLAIHGSYNWSVNARTNNHESVIQTTHKPTVDSLVTTFFDIKQRGLAILNGETTPDSDGSQLERFSNFETKDVKRAFASSNYLDEFTKILDSMIAAEVSNFDRNMLRSQGYERAKSSNGDPQILHKAFDSVYSIFINDINVVEDKKRRLMSKIEDQKTRSVQSLQETREIQLNTVGIDFENQANILASKIQRLQSDISRNEVDLAKIVEIKLPHLASRKKGLQNEISNLQQKLALPAWKLYEIIPAALLNLCLLIYLFIFYSSAAYILIFSQTDAEEAKKKNIEITPPEVFDPEAINHVLDKNVVAFLFVVLFVAIPIAFVLVKFVGNRAWSNVIGFVCSIVLVDGFVAFKVAKSIHEVRYLSGDTDDKWDSLSIFTNSDFYMVFVFGAAGLFLFKFSWQWLVRLFEARNPDAQRQINILAVKQLEVEEENLDSQHLELKHEEKAICAQITVLGKEVDSCERDRLAIPARKADEIQKKKQEFSVKIENIKSTSEIYKAHIENDHFPISINSMKDRINVFLEGWNDLLYEEFSVSKAEQKCAQAVEAAGQWLGDILIKSIDKRVQLN